MYLVIDGPAYTKWVEAMVVAMSENDTPVQAVQYNGASYLAWETKPGEPRPLQILQREIQPISKSILADQCNQ